MLHSYLVSDDNLVSSYIEGNSNALNILFSRHKNRLEAFIFSKVKNRDVMDDIIQDTFIKVINSLDNNKYKAEGKFINWLLRISRNLIIDYFRKNKRKKYVSSSNDFDVFNFIKDVDDNWEEKKIKNELIDDLKMVISKLPDKQKEVLFLRHYSNMSFEEIATNTGVSINTALGRMRYALLNLRKMIKNNKVDIMV